MLNRLAATIGKPRGNAAAGPAFLPPPTPNPVAATNGVVKSAVALRSVFAQPLPQAVPDGPLPRSAQPSWAHGPTMGGGMLISLPGPKLFFVRQRNEIDPPLAQVAGIGQVTTMTTARPGRNIKGRARIGGRHVTASPMVVPTWPVYGAGR